MSLKDDIETIKSYLFDNDEMLGKIKEGKFTIETAYLELERRKHYFETIENMAEDDSQATTIRYFAQAIREINQLREKLHQEEVREEASKAPNPFSNNPFTYFVETKETPV